MLSQGFSNRQTVAMAPPSMESVFLHPSMTLSKS
nr:MAG TPA: hypothetical protein [Caudoviricetes sp.]